MEDLNVSKWRRYSLIAKDLRNILRPRTATVVLLLVTFICGGIVAAWFAGEGGIETIFHQLRLLQENPPMWLKVPMVTGEFLFAPAIAICLVTFAITKISPQPQKWSRFAVVAIVLILTIRYVIWRSLSTLNLTDPLNGVFSLGLFGLEMLAIINGGLQLFLLVQTKDRQLEADIVSQAILNGSFTPSVDIFVPTYNEPAFILRRTIIGCQALDYAHKKIYLLDDTRRLEIKDLAVELGCEYLTRADNKHAKAGNLNAAIAQTHGDLIVVFDADFIPTQNFLTRTLGFFQDEKVGLVQTPQSFYSADPIARNLGLENILVPEQEYFYRQIQPVRDGTDSVVCAGTSFVMRRSALLSTGTGDGFVTSSLSEDYFTSVRLSGKGYSLVYLDEKLSAGAAPDDMGAQATQRLRWAQGTLQAFFIDENPLTIPGLRPLQRISHLTGLLHWFSSLSRVGFLLIPLAYSFLGLIPVRASTEEVIFYFLPQYLVHITVFAWLSRHSSSAFLSDIYDVVLCFPLAATVLQTMLRPFSRGFQVTPKGGQRDKVIFNWSLAWPLIILFIATAVSFWRNLGNCMMQMSNYPNSEAIKGLSLGWIWSVYNWALIGVALLVMLDVPKPDLYEWFELKRVVRLVGEKFTYWGTTTIISEAGMQVLLTQAGLSPLSAGEILPSTVEIMEEQLSLEAHITSVEVREDAIAVKIMFTEMELHQHRRLVEMLFCRPGQWKIQTTPGELMSLFILFRSLLRPRALFGRKQESAIAISQL